MAQTTIDTLLVRIKADTKQLESELKKLRSKTQQSTKQMSKGFMQLDKGLARTVRNIGLVGGAIGVAFGVANGPSIEFFNPIKSDKLQSSQAFCLISSNFLGATEVLIILALVHCILSIL